MKRIDSNIGFHSEAVVQLEAWDKRKWERKGLSWRQRRRQREYAGFQQIIVSATLRSQ